MSWIGTEQNMAEAYDNYQRYLFFAERGTLAHGRFTGLLDRPILVAGCGFGYLVDDLAQRGFTNVVGIDASAYCVQKAQSEVPAVADNIIQGDVLNPVDLEAARQLAGLSGNKKFALCITEDLLPCAESQTEAQNMLDSLRSVSKKLFHILTPRLADTPQDPEFLWLTPQEWSDLVGGGEGVAITGSYQVV